MAQHECLDEADTDLMEQLTQTGSVYSKLLSDFTDTYETETSSLVRKMPLYGVTQQRMHALKSY